MATGDLHSKGAPLRHFRIPAEGVAGYRILAPILAALAAGTDVELSVDGMDGQETRRGFHLRARSGSSAAGNFTPSWDGAKITFTPGTFAGITPTIGGNPIDVPVDGVLPGLDYDGSGTFYAWLHVSASLTAANDYVYAFTWGDMVIDGGSTLPDDAPDEGDFYILLCTYVDGVLTGQDVRTSLDGRVLDDATSTSQGQLFWWEA